MRKLMPHQSKAFAYLMKNRHGALFMEMRTGKTLPTIRRIVLTKPRRVLIMAPNSALGSWENELNNEGISDVVYLQGSRAERLATLREGHTWNLINREGWSVLPEIGNRTRCPDCNGRSTRAMPCATCKATKHIDLPRGERVTWDAVVLDESTFIKSPRAQVTTFVLDHLARCAVRRYILTGLPNPEGDMDFWCQLAWLDGKAFGYRSFWGFRAGMFSQEDAIYCWEPKQNTPTQIRDYVQDRAFICSRRDAKMPEHVVKERRVIALPKQLRTTYDKAEKDFILEHENTYQKTIHACTKWQWLRQMCGGFIERKQVWDGKLKALRELVMGELRREKIVVWFAYNAEVHAAAHYVGEGKAYIMTGEVPPAQRRDIVRWFGGDGVRVLYLQQKIAEYGMDLSAADTAIYYSRNPALLTDRQCSDRIVHPKKSNNLLHVDLVVKDSVDEDVCTLLEDKRWTSQMALDVELGERLRRRTQ